MLHTIYCLLVSMYCIEEATFFKIICMQIYNYIRNCIILFDLTISASCHSSESNAYQILVINFTQMLVRDFAQMLV